MFCIFCRQYTCTIVHVCINYYTIIYNINNTVYNAHVCFYYFQPPISNDDQFKQMIEHAAHQLSADNTELACAFIQKTAVEKVVPEMEKRLSEVRVIHTVVAIHTVVEAKLFTLLSNSHCG